MADDVLLYFPFLEHFPPRELDWVAGARNEDVDCDGMVGLIWGTYGQLEQPTFRIPYIPTSDKLSIKFPPPVLVSSMASIPIFSFLLAL